MTSSPPATPPPGRPLQLGILLVIFFVTALYWAIWFFGPRVWLASANTSEYFAFENAFPVADGWMALTGALGAWALWKRRPTALLWMLACGSATLYLAGMDILFDLENGIYRAPTGDWGGVVTEIIINVFCVVCGAALMRWSWKHREPLLAGA